MIGVFRYSTFCNKNQSTLWHNNLEDNSSPDSDRLSVLPSSRNFVMMSDEFYTVHNNNMIIVIIISIFIILINYFKS